MHKPGPMWMDYPLPGTTDHGPWQVRIIKDMRYPWVEVETDAGVRVETKRWYLHTTRAECGK